MRMKESDWQSVLDANLSGVFRVTKAALRGMMKARGGRIVNVASVVGLMGNAGQTNYSAAKAGLLGFTRSLAREVGSRQITVNAIAPGFIETDMTRDLDDKTRETMLAQIPLQRLGHVDDIAASVAFLVSDAAAYITGETLSVNGGLYMGA
jgi:3-oxoacyl-[acyl-carrier protein] reductase